MAGVDFSGYTPYHPEASEPESVLDLWWLNCKGEPCKKNIDSLAHRYTYVCPLKLEGLLLKALYLGDANSTMKKENACNHVAGKRLVGSESVGFQRLRR